MDLYNEILQELEARNTAQWNKFPPFFTVSIGCHIFNLVNQQQKIYFESGMLQNTRFHICMIAPQGFSKSFWLKHFLDGPTSVLGDTVIKTDFELKMSEAGYIGTIKFGENHQIIETPGLCQEESNSIVGIEEFSDLMKSMTDQKYNVGLENELLTTLDSGKAVKRLAAGKLDYTTSLTLWTATQPGRYNLTSGLARRFAFLFNIPTLKEVEDLKARVWETDNVTIDMERLNKLKKDVNEKFNDIFTRTQRIEFDPKFEKYIKTLDPIHYETSIYKRIGLGYWLMKLDDVKDTIVIKLDSTIKKLIDYQFESRLRLKQGTQESMVWMLLKNETDVPKKKITKILLDFGMSMDEITFEYRKFTHGEGMIEIDDKGIIHVNQKAKDDDLLNLEGDFSEFSMEEQTSIDGPFEK